MGSSPTVPIRIGSSAVERLLAMQRAEGSNPFRSFGLVAILIQMQPRNSAVRVGAS